MSDRSLVLAAVLLGATVLTTGCNSILGISSATLDDAGSPLVLTDAAVKATCPEYCATVFANCTGQYAEYIDVPEQDHICETICGSAAWESGNALDTTGDSLACRVTHAVLAKSDPGNHCQAAGPIGGGVCGADKCQGFCEQVEPYCGDLAYDSSPAECLTACHGFTYNVGPDAGDLVEEGDDTLNCRVYHLENAYRGGPNQTTHCPHTIIQSAVCFNADGGS